MSSDEISLAQPEPQVEPALPTPPPPEPPQAATRKKARKIVRAEPIQKHLLEAAFKKTARPSYDDIISLEDQTGLPRKWIISWFQRQRARIRRKDPNEGLTSEDGKRVKSECQGSDIATIDNLTDASSSPRDIVKEQSPEKTPNALQELVEVDLSTITSAAQPPVPHNSSTCPDVQNRGTDYSPPSQPQADEVNLGISLGKPLPIAVPLSRPMLNRTSGSVAAAPILPSTHSSQYPSSIPSPNYHAANPDLDELFSVLTGRRGSHLNQARRNELDVFSEFTSNLFGSAQTLSSASVNYETAGYQCAPPSCTPLMPHLDDFFTARTGTTSTGSSPCSSLGPTPALPPDLNGILQPVASHNGWSNDLGGWTQPLIAPVPHHPVPSLQALNAHIDNFHLGIPTNPRSENPDFDFASFFFSYAPIDFLI